MKYRDSKPPLLPHIFIMCWALLSFAFNAQSQPSISRNSNLKFGTVVSGGGVYPILLGSSTEGRATISGTNSLVYVTLSMPATLANGANNISYTWGAAYNNNANDPATATPFSSATATFVLNKRQAGSYRAFIYIYGSVDLSSVAASGNYKGSAVVSVSYSPSGVPNNSVTVNLTATVIEGLALQSGGSLSFGTVVAGTTPAAIDPHTSSSAATITAAGNGGQSVTISFPATTTLASGVNTLTYLPSLYGFKNNNQGSSSQITSGGTINLSGSTGNEGNFYFWLGGSLGAIPVGQAPGSYSGVFVISASY